MGSIYPSHASLAELIGQKDILDQFLLEPSHVGYTKIGS